MTLDPETVTPEDLRKVKLSNQELADFLDDEVSDNDVGEIGFDPDHEPDFNQHLIDPEDHPDDDEELDDEDPDDEEETD